VKVDILLQGEPVDAFSAIVHKDSAAAYGNKMTTSASCSRSRRKARSG
jgi:GTP-binding protein LepA